MSGGGSSGQSTESTSTSEPWAGLQPFLQSGYRTAERNILNRPTEFFQGSTVVPFASETRSALDATSNRASQGSPLLKASQDYTQGLLTDPASTSVYDSILSDVRPGIDSSFAFGRRTGSPAHAEALGRGLGRAFAPYAESAAGRAPGLAREDYYDIGRLADVGAARESKAGERLQEDVSRFNFNQTEPQQRVMSYMQALSGFPGVGGTTTARQQSSGRNSSNPLLTAAGLGLGGAATAGGLGWQPFGGGK